MNGNTSDFYYGVYIVLFQMQTTELKNATKLLSAVRRLYSHHTLLSVLSVY